MTEKEALPKNCINCNTEFVGEFCHSCGQKRKVGKLSVVSFFAEYVDRIFGMDTRFLRTVRDLSMKPGLPGQAFIAGNRTKYIGPAGYFFLISTLYILSFALLKVNINDYIKDTAESMSSAQDLAEMSEGGLAFQQNIMQKVSDNIRLVGFLIVPFMGIWGKAFYRKSGLNFLEHTVNALYIQGHLTVLSIVGVVIFKIFDFNVSPFLIILNTIYFSWSAMSFYRRKGFGNALRGVMFYLVSMISFVLSFMVIGFISILIYAKYINPEFMEQFK